MLGEKGGTPVCGIIGYTGENNAEEILLQGLHALEYRGYDSAGTTVFDKSGKPVTVKCRGRVENLAQKAAKKESSKTVKAVSDKPAPKKRGTKTNKSTASEK